MCFTFQRLICFMFYAQQAQVGDAMIHEYFGVAKNFEVQSRGLVTSSSRTGTRPQPRVCQPLC